MINPLQAVAQTAPTTSAQPPPAPTAPTAPTAPAAPAAPVFAAPSQTTDYRTLQARRNELSRQLNSSEGRREEVLKELRQAPQGAERAGLEARLGQLDQRILQIERDIQINGAQLVANPRSTSQDASTTEPDTPRGRFNGNDIAPLAGIVSMFVLAPLAFAIARRIWRGAPNVHVHRDADGDRRLERIEQAVDAIAIEIERISEGQRFQNKLLGEGQALSMYGLGQQPSAEPVGVRGASAGADSRGMG